VEHVTRWDPYTTARLASWTSHYSALGSDAATAQRRALASVYQEVTRQAQLLAFADDFWVLFILFCGALLLLPLLQRVRMAPLKSHDAEPGAAAIHAE
jgi:hypothetical protein